MSSILYMTYLAQPVSLSLQAVSYKCCLLSFNPLVSHSFFSCSILFYIPIAVSVSISVPSELCLDSFPFLALLHVPGHGNRILGLPRLFRVGSPSIESVTDSGFRLRALQVLCYFKHKLKLITYQQPCFKDLILPK